MRTSHISFYHSSFKSIRILGIQFIAAKSVAAHTNIWKSCNWLTVKLKLKFNIILRLSHEVNFICRIHIHSFVFSSFHIEIGFHNQTVHIIINIVNLKLDAPRSGQTIFHASSSTYFFFSPYTFQAQICSLNFGIDNFFCQCNRNSAAEQIKCSR